MNTRIATKKHTNHDNYMVVRSSVTLEISDKGQEWTSSTETSQGCIHQKKVVRTGKGNYLTYDESVYLMMGWYVAKEKDRARAWAVIQRYQPQLLIGTPPPRSQRSQHCRR